jgi:hypothetical protein
MDLSRVRTFTVSSILSHFPNLGKLFLHSPLVLSIFSRLLKGLYLNRESDTLQNTTTVVNLIMPPDVLWHGTAYYLLPPTQRDAAWIRGVPFISPQPTPMPLLIWVALYCIVLPVLAAWRFQYQDL